jgi:hypothetical protein
MCFVQKSSCKDVSIPVIVNFNLDSDYAEATRQTG